MSIVKTIATGGVAPGNTLRPKKANAQSMLLLDTFGLPTSPSPGSNVKSIPNYEETLGVLSVSGQIPVEGTDYASPCIKVTITPTFPEDYQGHFAVLRGRSEYKRTFDDTPYKIIYENNDVVAPTEDIVFYDFVEPGQHYYYSILVLVGSAEEARHYEYNPSTGFGTAYSYGEYGHTAIMTAQLPERWQVKQSGEDGDYTDRFISIFGKLFDSIKTDIDAYMDSANNIWSVQEQQLQALADLIGWEVNRELREKVQRQELDAASDFYNIKGRNQGLRFLVQLATGFIVEFEEGWRRVIRADNLCVAPDPDDAYAIAHQGQPWLPIRDEVLGSSTGLPSQTFVLANTYAERVIVEVNDGTDWVEWREVDLSDLNTGGDPTDERFAFSVDSVGIGTVTFADALNGAIPVLGTDNIRASYHYGGDVLCYSPDPPLEGRWRNDVGVRLILQDTPSSREINDVFLNKVSKILRYKPSYSIFAMVVVPSSIEEENAPVAVDEFDDTTVQGTILRTNTAGHQKNRQYYIKVVH